MLIFCYLFFLLQNLHFVYLRFDQYKLNIDEQAFVFINSSCFQIKSYFFFMRTPFLTAMLALICLALLLPFTLSNCVYADYYECQTSLCTTFYWANGTCKSNVTATCTTGVSVLSGGQCANCSSLAQSLCTDTCPDYYFSSSKRQCTPCWTTYGPNCIACTNTFCTECAFSSGTVNGGDGKSCVSSSCDDPNCVKCYSYNQKNYCQTCKSGYSVNASYGCSSAKCVIQDCTSCASAETCAVCATGYYLSFDSSWCIPVCSDPNCLNCIKPNYCGQCITGYNLTLGTCVIDCTKNQVQNCLVCNCMTSCLQCKPGYDLINYGSQCITKCKDVHCEYCSNASRCDTCDDGYYALDGTCYVNYCSVQYCYECASSTTCSQCQNGFALSNDSTICTPTCALKISECSRCASNSSCASCNAGYTLANNLCVASCPVTNCLICSSSTKCQTCQPSYRLSQNKKRCNPTCTIPNCLTCQSATRCATCQPGYLMINSTGSNSCVIQCSPWEVNTGTASNPNCVSCSEQIPYCQSCVSSGGNLQCNSCPEGFFVDGAGLCTLCSNIISECWSCTDSSTCTSCGWGYQLTQNNTCQAYYCSDTTYNCLSCSQSTPNICNTCISGFNLTNGTCLINCKKTYAFDAETGTCQCPSGTYQNSAKCTPCPDTNTYTCTISASLECNEGYFLSGTTCAACQEHCLTCFSADHCEDCDNGYSVNQNGSCISAGSGSNIVIGSDGQCYSCPIGCDNCVLSSLNTVVCTVPSPGFSIVGGAIIACDNSCYSCSSNTSSSCTACYSGEVLIGGTCRNCTDDYAVACLPGNPSFSLLCLTGYTASFVNVSGTLVGGVCSACAANCLQCDASGPGNCDAGKCVVGFVVVVGTTNCTACLGGCPSCSSYNPGSCLSCPNGQYQTGNGLCSLCAAGCATCSSGSACDSCPTGFSLVGGSCHENPSFCVNLTSATECFSCFVGYKLGLDRASCSIDLSCNSTSTCVTCAEGSYLNSGKCFTCGTLPTHCIACDASTACIKCANGFYISKGVCIACQTNCLTCTSNSYCTKAADGYFLELGGNKNPNGKISKCRSPCSNCTRNAKLCTSCVDNYTLNGTQCLGKKRVTLSLVLQGTDDAKSILQSGSNPTQTLYSGVTNINRLLSTLCKNLPSEFNIKNDEQCYDTLKMSFLGAGSLLANVDVVGGPYTSDASASTAFQKSIGQGTTLDGVKVFSVSTTVQGYTPGSNTNNNSSPNDGTNLALILGLSIPLTVLLVLIIVVLALRNRQEKDTGADIAEREDGDGVNSVDQVEKHRHEKI